MKKNGAGIVIDSGHFLVYNGDLRAKLTRSNFELFTAIWKARGSISGEALFRQHYQLRPLCDQPQYKVIHTFMSKMRVALIPIGLDIVCDYGQGYTIARFPSEGERIAA